MNDKLSWGILGNATIARKCMMPAIANSRNGKIRALGTNRPQEADSVVRHNDIELVYGSYDELLEDAAVDAVYISLPNQLHLEWSLKALAAGKHVLCEKPLACTAGEARRMMVEAHKRGRILMEALMYRFHPRTLRVKELITDGAIGTPRLVRAAFCFSMAEELLQDDTNHRLNSQRGGGALLDVGCYGVSVARWLLEAEPVMVQAQAIFTSGGSVDLQLVGSLRFDHGALATIEASFCSGLQQTYSVVGSGGVIDLPQDAFVPWDKDAVIYYRRGDAETAEEIVIPGADEYCLMVEHFGDRVLHGTEPQVAAEDSICNMQVLDALREAARSGHSVSVDIGDRPDVKTR